MGPPGKFESSNNRRRFLISEEKGSYFRQQKFHVSEAASASAPGTSGKAAQSSGRGMKGVAAVLNSPAPSPCSQPLDPPSTTSPLCIGTKITLFLSVLKFSYLQHEEGLRDFAFCYKDLIGKTCCLSAKYNITVKNKDNSRNS